MDKKEVAAVLEEMALLLELAGENPFKVRAYEAGARAVLTLPGDLEALVRSRELAQVKGIGKTLAGVIGELAASGQAKLHQELRAQIHPGLMELLKVPGLGPKKARLLHEQLQISSLGELEYACRENRLVSLPGFGARTQEKIIAGLAHVRRYAGLFRLGDLLPLAEKLLSEVRRVPGVLRAEAAGDLRRRLEISPGLDLVAAAANPEEAAAGLVRLPFLAQAEVREPGRLEAALPQGIRLRLFLARPEVFGAAHLVLTGSEAHLEDLRALAAKEGLTLEETGLSRGAELLPSREEEEIYRRLGLPLIPPELREGLGETATALEGRLPRLVTDADLKGCFHIHSYYSDGVNSLEELLAAARGRGWGYLGLSDHSQSAYYAGGLKPPDLARQKEEVAAQRLRHPDLALFWGVESDILPGGSLDYPDELLADFDFVIASIHSQFNLDREAMTGRILKALANPYCTMLGHASGRLLLAREPYAVDLERILEFAQKNRIIMELNASPYRLDLDWRRLKKAKEMGVLISINPDAHDLAGLDDMAYGVMAARKGWLAPEDVLNTYPAADAAWLLARRRDRQ